MEHKLAIGVFRRFDHELVTDHSDSEAELALHNRRKDALIDVFENEDQIIVKDWGQTKDTEPHEFVELVLGIVGTAVFNYAIVPGLKYVGEKFAEKLVDDTISNSVKWIISKLRPKQESKEILDFQIKLPNGTLIAVDPPDRNASITIHFNDGKVESINYDAEKS
ncbi:hypothetical protein [Aquimarina rubra]|uniref:Uncharacterized protein n=1 Tax=Aquimarina rubra TaxID=1920033 RepID=A0ABW5L980_9FLAO